MYLEQELESLKAVLEIKNEKLHQQDKKLMQIEKLVSVFISFLLGRDHLYSLSLLKNNIPFFLQVTNSPTFLSRLTVYITTLGVGVGGGWVATSLIK